MRPSFYIPPVNDDCKALRVEVSRQRLSLLDDDATEGDWSDSPIFFYGSIEGMKHLQRPGIHYDIIDWCDWQKLTCTNYYAKWGHLLLTRNYGFYPLAEVHRLSCALWSAYSDKEGRAYVRPNSNDKVFAGGVFKRENFAPWLLQAEPESLTDDLLCLVGKPTPILAEYRLVVAGGKVVTGSMYIMDECIRYEQSCPASAVVIAEEAARLWSPHPVFVLDIAYTLGGEYLIIECGSIHTVGLYECDLEKVVKAIVAHSSS
jgi:hypothetical protein